MKNLLQFQLKPAPRSARVVDGKLILSFPEALTPVLWQMELNEAKASALEVKAGSAPDTHALMLRTARGETLEVAPFATRQEAVEALMAVAHALENAHGQIRGGNTTVRGAAKTKSEGGPGRWLAGILGLLLVFLLFSLWSSLSPRPPSGMSGPAASTATASGQPQAGVPLSADDYLRGR